MKSLVVEDNFTCRVLLQKLLQRYGVTDAVEDGKEAVTAVQAAVTANAPYDLICLDIMMPEMSGHDALREIRDYEEAQGFPCWEGKGSKIIMTTALDDMKNVMASFKGLCDGYLVKPVKRANLVNELEKLGLL